MKNSDCHIVHFGILVETRKNDSQNMDENQHKLLNLHVFVVVLEDFSFGHPGMLLQQDKRNKGLLGYVDKTAWTFKGVPIEP